jgi:hypothetical protein
MAVQSGRAPLESVVVPQLVQGAGEAVRHHSEHLFRSAARAGLKNEAQVARDEDEEPEADPGQQHTGLRIVPLVGVVAVFLLQPKFLAT